MWRSSRMETHRTLQLTNGRRTSEGEKEPSREAHRDELLPANSEQTAVSWRKGTNDNKSRLRLLGLCTRVGQTPSPLTQPWQIHQVVTALQVSPNTHVLRFKILNYVIFFLPLCADASSVQTCVASSRQGLQHQPSPQAIYVCLYPFPPWVDALSQEVLRWPVKMTIPLAMHNIYNHSCQTPYTSDLSHNWLYTQLSFARRQPLLIQGIS